MTDITELKTVEEGLLSNHAVFCGVTLGNLSNNLAVALGEAIILKVKQIMQIGQEEGIQVAWTVASLCHF